MNSEHLLLQMFLRAWPLKRGVNRMIGRILGRISFRNQFECVATTDGFKIHIMPNDLLGSFLYLTGEFDRVIFEVLFEHAKAGDVLLDIGANIGYVSACFLANVSESKAIAIEPLPQIGDLLEKNLSQFSNRYQIARIALSSRDGVGDLAISKENSGHSQLTDEPGTNTVRVELCSVERFLSKFGVDRAELIKIDVEGHEKDVIKGLAPHLSRLRTRAILFEDHTKQSGVDGSIGAMLDGAGYEIFRIHKRYTRVDLVPVRNTTDCTSPEFIAIKRKH